MVDETMFCDTCGAAMGQPPADPDGDAASQPVPTERTWQVADLVDLPVLDYGDPGSRGSRPQPPRVTRLCRKDGCVAVVGGPGPDPSQPPLTEGFCHLCGTPFFLSPRLRSGDLLAGRYEVDGFVKEGGQGWIYRARDTSLDGAYVVLKGLINPNDQVAVQQAVAERRFLTELDHPNIVRILDFVTHGDSKGPADYIVMEHLNGQSLLDVTRSNRRRPPPAMPLEQVLAYGHEVLAALEYLHEQDLLYCDMKPDNVMRCADRIKVIDLGAVRWIDDHSSPVIGTRGYQVPGEEIGVRGLSVRSDLYTLGKTLGQLFPDPVSADRDRPVEVAHESFRRLKDRAAHPDWDRRFASAAEMSDQLKGVLREYLSLRDRREQPAQSSQFAPTPELLDGGLGAVPPLVRWTQPDTRDILAASLPAGAARAVGLPIPKPEPDDPAADFLASVVAPDPANLIAKLSGFPEPSVGIQLCGCRAYLERGDLPRTKEWLAHAETMLGRRAAADWRLSWHRGLIALTEGDLAAAREVFDAVYRMVPGESAPKLALGLCAELLGDEDSAVRYYEAVWRRDHTEASAAFGLARIRLTRGDRRAAIRMLDEVPRVSRHYDAARIAAVRVCFEPLSTGPPTEADLREADDRLPGLHLDGGDPDGEARARLTTAFREVLLAHATSDGQDGRPAARGGRERVLRAQVEEAFRTVARQARSPEDHAVLVDRANEVRPRTLWSR
jgi:serine/threonine-protein kinase PknG